MTKPPSRMDRTVLEVDQGCSALKPTARKMNRLLASAIGASDREFSSQRGVCTQRDVHFAGARDTTTELSLFHTLAATKSDRVAS